MTETVTQAVAKRNDAEHIIEQYTGDFANVLPQHVTPETFVRLAQGVLRRDENLGRVARQNPGSFLAALLECARLGHEPGTKAFYLVPFGNEIQGIEGYRGVVERMYRAGAVSAVKAEVVHENDRFRYTPQMARPEHEPDWFSDRGPIIGAYAYAEMKDGTTSKVVVINLDYLAKVKKESRGSDKPTSPWVKWEGAMVLKTVAHRLEPWVPTSNEFRREQLRAAVEADNLRRPADVTDGEIVEAE